MSFIAQYHGACIDCGGDVLGDEVNFVTFGELQHVKCPDEYQLEKPAGVPLCPRCFTYHPGEC